MRFERLFLLVAFAVAAILPLIVRNEYLVHIGVIILFSVTMGFYLWLVDLLLTNGLGWVYKMFGAA